MIPTPHLVNWDDHRSETSHRFHALKSFISVLRVALTAQEQKAKSDLDARFEDALALVQGEFSPEDLLSHTVLYHYAPHLRKYHHDIPRLFHYSSLIQLYGLFEERGRALCKELKTRDPSILIGVDELRDGGDFESIRIFLNKLCQIQFKHWHDLVFLREVRNRIVHHNGFVPDAETWKKFSGKVENANGIRIDAARQLMIEASFVDSMYDRVWELFEVVFKARGFGEILGSCNIPDHAAIIVNQVQPQVKVELYSSYYPKEETGS